MPATNSVLCSPRVMASIWRSRRGALSKRWRICPFRPTQDRFLLGYALAASSRRAMDARHGFLFQHAEPALDLRRQAGASRFAAFAHSMAARDARLRALPTADDI